MDRHAARKRAHRLVRRFLPARPQTRQATGLRLVRGAPFMAAIDGDRVVQAQLRAGEISLDAVRTAWYHMRNYEDTRALWRILADVQGVDSSALFRTAARVYHFETASVSTLGTAVLIDGNRRYFAPALWHRLISMGVFPIRETNDPLDQGVRWTFGSHDPARVDVRQHLDRALSQPFRLKFVEPDVLFHLIQASFEIEDAVSIPWYRYYVLGRKPIALTVAPASNDLRRAA